MTVKPAAVETRRTREYKVTVTPCRLFSPTADAGITLWGGTRAGLARLRPLLVPKG